MVVPHGFSLLAVKSGQVRGHAMSLLMVGHVRHGHAIMSLTTVWGSSYLRWSCTAPGNQGHCSPVRWTWAQGGWWSPTMSQLGPAPVRPQDHKWPCTGNSDTPRPPRCPGGPANHGTWLAVHQDHPGSSNDWHICRWHGGSSSENVGPTANHSGQTRKAWRSHAVTGWAWNAQARPSVSFSV